MTSLEVDNSWVAPLCAILIRIFKWHIKIELCISRVGSLKYLFKYVCKGKDSVAVDLSPTNPAKPNQTLNKIKNYVYACYVSTFKEIWRLLGYTYINRQPPVARLDVHLPGHQNVYFRDGEMYGVSGRPNNRAKPLQWFEAKSTYTDASNLTFVEFAK